jgi:hypothetical protein
MVVGGGDVGVVIAVAMVTPLALGSGSPGLLAVTVFTAGYCLLSGRQAVQTVVHRPPPIRCPVPVLRDPGPRWEK